MNDRVDPRIPDAHTMRVVLLNLNTLALEVLHDALDNAEARYLVSRSEYQMPADAAGL
jgi:hypothetical protein